MIDPIFWLGLSILLVAVSITAVLVAAVPAFLELGRAARSAEKLFDTLNRELPPTLEAIRLTGLEITELTDDVSQGVQSAGQVAKQVDQSIAGVKQQVQKAQTTTRGVFAGVKAAWRSFNQPVSTKNRGSNRLPPSVRAPIDLELRRNNLQSPPSNGVDRGGDSPDFDDQEPEPKNSQNHAVKKNSGDRPRLPRESKPSDSGNLQPRGEEESVTRQETKDL